MMMNEVVRALDDRVIGSAREGGIGAIYGIDFPPFLGGPFVIWSGWVFAMWLILWSI